MGLQKMIIEMKLKSPRRLYKFSYFNLIDEILKNDRQTFHRNEIPG